MLLIKKILSATILPPFSLILLGLAGLWISRRHSKFGGLITLTAILLMALLSTPFIATNLMRTLEWYQPISPDALSETQAIVILGGGNNHNAPEYGGATVGAATLERIRYGVHIQRISGLPILVTGGSPFGGAVEAEVMRDSIERDFAGKVRWMESTSRDTAENASLSAALLREAGISHIVLVSHAWHLPRAIKLFQESGLETTPAPTSFTSLPNNNVLMFIPKAESLSSSSRAIQEWIGILINSTFS